MGTAEFQRTALVCATVDIDVDVTEGLRDPEDARVDYFDGFRAGFGDALGWRVSLRVAEANGVEAWKSFERMKYFFPEILRRNIVDGNC